MNKIQINLIHFLAILFFIGYGQKNLVAQNNGYVKTYVFEERQTLFYAVREFDGEILVTGQLKVSATTGKWGVFLARLDTFGNVLKLLIFQDPEDGGHLVYPAVLSEPFCVNEDGSIILSGSLNGLENSFVILVNSDMDNIQFHKLFRENIEESYTNNCFLDRSAAYIIGRHREFNASYDGFIRKIDLDGNLIWERNYGLSTGFEQLITITSNNNHYYLVGDARETNTEEFSEIESRTLIMKIDSAGNIITKYLSEISEEGASAEDLIINNHRYYYVTHLFSEDDIGNKHFAPQIVCRDMDFNLIWRKEYGEPYFLNAINDIVFGLDGYLYAAGYIPEDGYTWGRVLKIDPEDGEVIWEARDTAFVIPGWGSRNRMEGLTALPSGSLIAVGYTMDPTFRENGLIYKVTADGCIDTLCTTLSIGNLLDNPDERVVVYPNPASDVISFSLPDSEECVVEVYSLDGVNLHRENLTQNQNSIYLERSKYTDGLYFWKVTTRAGQVVDSGKVFIVN